MSTYYVGNIPYDSDYLAHYGREGQRKGYHLPDVWARLKAAGQDAGRKIENALGITAKKQLDAAKGGEEVFRNNYRQAYQAVAPAMNAYKQAQQSHNNVQSQYQLANQYNQANRGMMISPMITTTRKDVDDSARNLQKAKATSDNAVGRRNTARKLMLNAKQDVKNKQAAYDKTVAGRVDKAINKISSGVKNIGKNIGKTIDKISGKTAKTEYQQAKAQQNASGGSSAMDEYVQSKKKAYDQSVIGRVENAIAKRQQASANAKVKKKNEREQKDGTAAKREVDRLTRLKNTADTNNYSVKKEIAQNDLDAKKKTEKLNAKLRNIDSMSGSGAGNAMASERARILSEKAAVEKERASKNQQAASKSKFSDAYRSKIDSDLNAAKTAYASSKLGKKEAGQKKVENTIKRLDKIMKAARGDYDGRKVESAGQVKARTENNTSVFDSIVNAQKAKSARDQARKNEHTKNMQAKTKEMKIQRGMLPDNSSSHYRVNKTGGARKGGSGGSFNTDRFNAVYTHQNQIKEAQEREQREIEEAKKKRK